MKLTKNGREIVSNLSKEEAIAQLAILIDDYAMSTNYYITDGDHKVTDPDNGRVLFEVGDESATIGDATFEIVED